MQKWRRKGPLNHTRKRPMTWRFKGRLAHGLLPPLSSLNVPTLKFVNAKTIAY